MQQPSEINRAHPAAERQSPPARHYSQRAYELTRHFEGLRLRAYQDQSGIWTIGYGHTGPDVHAGLTITEAEANALLVRGIAIAAACVCRVVTVDLSQGQFDALVDFVFNLGCERLRGSTLLAHVNAAEFDLAAAQFLRWDHAGGVAVPGLLVRRQAEMALFQSKS